MKKSLEQLVEKLEINISDCKRFEPKAAKQGRYEDAVELKWQRRFTEKIVCDLKKILNEET